MASGDDKDGLSGNATLGIGLVVCAGLVVAAIVGMRFMRTPPPPPAQRIAVPTEQVLNTGLKYTEGYYKATVEENAKALQLPVPTVAQLAAPLVYADELPAPRTMKADHDQIDTPHLHIATKVVKEWSSTGAAQSMRVEHMMMFITNKSDKPVAYRVETEVLPDPARCRSKAVLTQNAIALRPGETIERSECFWFKNAALEIRAIEVLELPDLSYFYVSRVNPIQALLNERSTAGHVVPGKQKQCTFVPWREIKAASEAKDGVRWADVIDFYARHNCDEYSFFTTYRRWTAPGSLPAREGVPTAAALEPSTKTR